MTNHISYHLRQVILWTKIFRVYLAETPQIPSEDIIKLRLSLLKEEISELEKALNEKDIVEVADALSDIQFVLDGTILACGLQNHIHKINTEVFNSNMSKLEDGQPKKRQDGKIMKGKNYYPPNIKKCLT